MFIFKALQIKTVENGWLVFSTQHINGKKVEKIIPFLIETLIIEYVNTFFEFLPRIQNLKEDFKTLKIEQFNENDFCVLIKKDKNQPILYYKNNMPRYI